MASYTLQFSTALRIAHSTAAAHARPVPPTLAQYCTLTAQYPTPHTVYHRPGQVTLGGRTLSKVMAESFCAAGSRSHRRFPRCQCTPDRVRP
eukprot:201788-Rhodomonas_salina.1